MREGSLRGLYKVLTTVVHHSFFVKLQVTNDQTEKTKNLFHVKSSAKVSWKRFYSVHGRFRDWRDLTLYSGSVENSGVQCLMQFVTFGKVRLSNCDFSRPKPLLLLSYVTLEGPQERRKLADLFWTEVAPAKNDVSKKLGKLSVVLTQFKREGAPVFPDTPGLDPLPSLVECDAPLFLTALEKNELKKALELYQGPFLHDLGKPLDDLEVGNEILEWVLEKREFFGEKARSAMLQLAEEAHEAGHKKEATQWAEKAFSLSEAPEMEPAQLSRLQYLLGVKSEVKKKVAKAVQASLDEISPEARGVFLALSLQSAPHLAVIREALKLSIDVLSQTREELLLSGLVDAESRVLATDMAKDWLKEHPAERVPLLMKLARATPANEAFALYHSIYAETKGFGGIGDLQKARKAYEHKARALMGAKDYAATIETLAELREVERMYEAEPEVQCRFFEAYALERLGRFKESFELLQTLPEELHTPDITSLQSVLFFRLGKNEEARRAAEAVIQNGVEWLWARANATNTLGNLSLSGGELLEAASYFKKAATLFHATGDKDRWVGCLNNYAVALSKMAVVAEANGDAQPSVEAKRGDAIRAYHEALEALDQMEDVPQLRAHILFNLGSLWSAQHDWGQTEFYYLQAAPLAEQVGMLDLAAHLHLNLGNLYNSRQQIVQAKTSFARAIEIAAKAGEPFVQAMAVANLADLDNDPDAMEIGLELLEQSGHLDDHLAHFLEIYETILKRLLEQTRLHNDPLKERLYLKKLTSFHRRHLPETEAFNLETTFTQARKPTEVN